MDASFEIGFVLALFDFATLIFGLKLAVNWVCFLISPIVHFLIFTCQKRAYDIFNLLDIGFVLHKKGRNCKVLSTGVERIPRQKTENGRQMTAVRKQKTGVRKQKSDD